MNDITGYGLGNKGLLCDECEMIITRDKWNNHIESHFEDDTQ